MEKVFLKKFSISWLGPIITFLIYTFILFRPYFLKGLVPIPGDILIGHYYPWKDQIWQGRTAGYPIKNFILFDGIRQTLPWRLLAIEQMKAGKWPLWNPYILSGMPLLGNIQSASFYPLNFLFFFLPELDAWTIYIFLQPVLAAIFAYFFIRTIGGSRLAGLLAGFCYGFSLIMMNHLEFGIDGHTALWLPLATSAINKIQKEAKKRWIMVLGIAVFMTLLGGYPPPAVYNLAIFGLYTLFKIRPLLSQKLIMVSIGIIFPFLLAAPQVIPALELASKVVREETQFGVLSKEPYFFPLENLIMTVAPDFFGHPSTNNFFSHIYYSDNPSIGIIGFVFVIYALKLIKRKKEVAFWLTVAILPMLLMLETPLGKSLRYIKFPFFSLVTPMRMIWAISVSFSFLAGIGLDEVFVLLKKLKQKKINFFQYVLPLAFVWELLILTWTFSLFLSNSHQIIAQRNLIIPTGLLLVVSLILVSSIFFNKAQKYLFLFIVLLAGVELVRQGIKYNPFLEKQLIFPNVRIIEQMPSDKVVYRTMVTHSELLPVNSNIPYRLPMIDGYASINDGRYGQMVKLANATFPVKRVEGYPRIVFQTDYKSQIIDLLGVKYVFSLKVQKSPKLKLIEEFGKTKIYENLEVFPRVFLVNSYFVEDNVIGVANRMLGTDLKIAVVLEKKPKLDVIQNVSLNGKAEIINYKENQVEVDVSSSVPALLVLTDSYDSGWQAEVDGKKTEILKTDFDLRSVVVPSGNHKIKFSYEPKSFFRGLTVSGSSFFALSIYLSALLIKKLPLFKKK